MRKLRRIIYGIMAILAVQSLVGVAWTQQVQNTLCVKLKTDQMIYEAEETVTVIFTNGCSKAINLPQPAEWGILGPNAQVNLSRTLSVAAPVLPSQQIRWTWDQTDHQGQQVPGLTPLHFENHRRPPN
jgi:hypothetical protein